MQAFLVDFAFFLSLKCKSYAINAKAAPDNSIAQICCC
ncbi:hypothetical protein GMES_4078 [Paraglaciecola mesophila KMM 241]|uniref:Uncharacterized protein n=1 Tax=Paraglaciecola mesophila KMM 241 TaxID=1128912 RepID=K6YQW6_9ALTE|nr:hypothetical protein GMES_4078 [Paraglaciecola mesophila KMM 241]